MTSWLQEGWIYQIFCGRWEREDEGTSFWEGLINTDWERVTNLGARTIYLLGVWDNQGPVLVKEEEGVNLENWENRVPSMMAISNHKQNNPELGSEEQLRQLIVSLHEKGLKVIADFVPNHTSTAHPWLESNPEYYKKINEDFVYEFSGDVVKLDYDNAQLRAEMTNVLMRISGLGFDGVRCDMAHLVPEDYWQEAITAVKSAKEGFGFIAEAYDASPFDQSRTFALLGAGFDAVYDQFFYKNTINVVGGNHPSAEIAAHLNYVNEQLRGGKVVQYAGNHDDPPLGNREKNEEKSALIDKYRQALTALVLFGGGVGMFTNGFLRGTSTRLAHHYAEKLPREQNELLAGVSENLLHVFELYCRQRNTLFNWVAQRNVLIGKSNQTNLAVVINLGAEDASLKNILGNTSTDDDVERVDKIISPGQVMSC